MTRRVDHLPDAAPDCPRVACGHVRQMDCGPRRAPAPDAGPALPRGCRCRPCHCARCTAVAAIAAKAGAEHRDVVDAAAAPPANAIFEWESAA